LIDHTVANARATGGRATATCDTVQFVKKQNARAGLPGFFKHIANIGFTFPHPFGQQLWAFDADEIAFALIGHRFREQRLPTPGRAVQQRSFWGLNAQFFKIFRVGDGEFNHFSQFC
jgi:hypothetical protein